MSALRLCAVDEVLGDEALYYQIAPGHGRALPFNADARYLATTTLDVLEPAISASGVHFLIQGTTRFSGQQAAALLTALEAFEATVSKAQSAAEVYRQRVAAKRVLSGYGSWPDARQEILELSRALRQWLAALPDIEAGLTMSGPQ